MQLVLVGDLGEMVTVESMPKQEGRNMIMVIAPNRRYLEQQARERAREDATAASVPETGEGTPAETPNEPDAEPVAAGSEREIDEG